MSLRSDQNDSGARGSDNRRVPFSISSLKTPYCQGSNEPTDDHQRTTCDHCGHLVAVVYGSDGGRIAKHWWSRGSIIHKPREGT